MANKQNFTPEEWISESVMLAGMAVSAAEPSGLWGTLKEAFASGSAVAAADRANGGVGAKKKNLSICGEHSR